MTVPEPSFRSSCAELALLPVADPWGACAEEEDGRAENVMGKQTIRHHKMRVYVPTRPIRFHVP